MNRYKSIGEGVYKRKSLPLCPAGKTAMKKKEEVFDGLNEGDIKKLQKAIRQVWSWSYSRRLVLKRCDLGEGYSRCEQCKKKVPKIYVDHIEAVGTFDDGYIHRLFVPSTQMQGLCNPCHKIKTKGDLASIKAKKRIEVSEDFY